MLHSWKLRINLLVAFTVGATYSNMEKALKTNNSSNVNEAMINQPYFFLLFYIHFYPFIYHSYTIYGQVGYGLLRFIDRLGRLSTASVTDETPGQAREGPQHRTICQNPFKTSRWIWGTLMNIQHEWTWLLFSYSEYRGFSKNTVEKNMKNHCKNHWFYTNGKSTIAMGLEAAHGAGRDVSRPPQPRPRRFRPVLLRSLGTELGPRPAPSAGTSSERVGWKSQEIHRKSLGQPEVWEWKPLKAHRFLEMCRWIWKSANIAGSCGQKWKLDLQNDWAIPVDLLCSYASNIQTVVTMNFDGSSKNKPTRSHY